MVVNVCLNVITVTFSQLLQSFTCAKASSVWVFSFCPSKCDQNSASDYSITVPKRVYQKCQKKVHVVRKYSFQAPLEQILQQVLWLCLLIHPPVGSCWCWEGCCLELPTPLHRCEAVSAGWLTSLPPCCFLQLDKSWFFQRWLHPSSFRGLHENCLFCQQHLVPGYVLGYSSLA